MTKSPAVRLITELALANKGFVVLPTGGVDGNALVKSGSGVAWGSGAGGTAVNSINGRTGAVQLSAADVNLANANNTSDLAKPISTATQAALNSKADYPVGGSNGQVLTKSGSTTSWASVSGSGTGGPSIVAPSPSGADDTATLQALLNQAQSTGGTLILQAGTYIANLATSQAINQPRIIGQGKNYTTIQGNVNTAPVLRFKGGSGLPQSGGYLADLRLAASSAGGGVGLEIADACGVTGVRLRLSGSLAEGVRFHNESTGGFSEYNVISAEFDTSVTLSVRYRRTSGNESFHGTGLGPGTLINQSNSSTGPEVQIDDGCFPYQAPLYVSMFTRTTAPLIACLNTTASRSAHFYGVIEVENFVADAVLVDPTPTRGIYFAGDILVFGNLGFSFGKVTRVDHTYFSDNGIVFHYKVDEVPVPGTATSPGSLGQIAQDGTWLYVCTATNTWKRAALATW